MLEAIWTVWWLFTRSGLAYFVAALILWAGLEALCERKR